MGIYLTVATEQGNLFGELGEQREFRGMWNIKNVVVFLLFVDNMRTNPFILGSRLWCLL